MNTAYLIAALALALVIFLGWVGGAMATDDDRRARDAAPWFLVPACALLLAAIIFAGIGIDLQYK